MSKKAKMNGSADLLANAMRQVLTEAVEAGVEPVRQDMKAMEKRLDDKIDKSNKQLNDRIDESNKQLNDRIETTNKNMQAQFAQQKKDFADAIKASRRG